MTGWKLLSPHVFACCFPSCLRQWFRLKKQSPLSCCSLRAAVFNSLHRLPDIARIDSKEDWSSCWSSGQPLCHVSNILKMLDTRNARRHLEWGRSDCERIQIRNKQRKCWDFGVWSPDGASLTKGCQTQRPTSLVLYFTPNLLLYSRCTVPFYCRAHNQRWVTCRPWPRYMHEYLQSRQRPCVQHINAPQEIILEIRKRGTRTGNNRWGNKTKREGYKYNRSGGGSDILIL